MTAPLNLSGLTQRLAAWWRQAVARPAADILLAQSCALCQLPSHTAPICSACAQDLPVLSETRCPQCALPLSPAQSACPDCARHRPNFGAAYAAWAYDFPIDSLIRDFKYGHHLYLGGFFAEHLARTIELDLSTTGQPRPDLIVPMPLHPNRLRTRGFNQAAEIARHLAKHFDIPCAYDALIRVQDTPPQAGLHRDARWRNLVGAFASTQPLTNKRILLVDDVLTTGASLSACADVLRHAGAGRVDVAVVARTLEPGSRNA